MNQELSFETIPLKLAPEIAGEMFAVESERGIRRSFAGPRSRSLRPGIRSGLRPKGVKRPPLSRPKPTLKGLRRPFGSAVYEPYPIASEPYSSEPEPSGSERTRWVQDCLNQAAGTQLPVNGIMGPETRKAVRNFQRQQGLRASGIVGPDTEDALKAACAGQNAGENSELESYSKEPGFVAWLTWQPSNEKTKLYTWEEIQKRPRDRIHGDVGVYIVVLFERRTVGGKTKKIITQILKVGKSIDQSFRERLGHKTHQDIRAMYPGKVGYYLAKIQASGACPVRGCGSVIEHLVARTLIRSGKMMLPHHKEPIVPIKALDQIQVANILPKPLAKNLGKAYAAAGPMDVRKQRIGPVAAPASGSGSLILPKNAVWELEYPFSEAEELELAAELLAISNEEELDLFLGKMFKGIGRGLKKFGRFVGKKVLPALGKGLKAIGKVALPIVGKALGSFIPIPGVGTAIGGAIGTAVSKALELEFSGFPAEEAELEMARRFVRIAATAARQAALANPHANPEAIANAALMAATRMHVPNLSATVRRGNSEVNGTINNEWYTNSIQPGQSGQEAFLGDVWNSISTGARKLSSGVADMLTDCTPIEDRTSFTPKDKRKGKPRDMSKVYALVLHQTAGNQRNTPPNRYDSVTAHFVIKPNGQILQLHPLAAYLNASNGFNAGSVAVEFSGNFPDIRGKRYVYPNGASPQGILTAEQIKAGRCLVRYLVKNMGLTHILAHRQSSASRANDPGPDIWYHVGQWAVNNLGLRDGGPNFKIGSGNPLSDIWRTWGKTRQQPELGEEIFA
ncbi:peptidoglycan recognition protein family protein [Nitrosomonas ureae]|uniref:N-acetylmuramoyl-L-alanine amidase n=1 Tax=Nitrosomonas ureae TaxID=44577 RepID=A0A1H5UZY7_9PROT|nr:N-acetylmuramoyl-L-alanine amidase [Nitrosomonas ureae]SEF80732.1 N-acetylmuramoyl-L-alanine amidase [Nitrosomonas ureae]